MQLQPVDRSPAQWRSQGADLYSTGASGAVPTRAVNPANAAESVDKLGDGTHVGQATKSTSPDEKNRDWTLPVDKKDKARQAEETPKDPPLYKVLLEFIQSMWRASGSAVEVAQDANKTALQELAQKTKNQQQATYADPKVKRSSSL